MQSQPKIAYVTQTARRLSAFLVGMSTMILGFLDYPHPLIFLAASESLRHH